MSFSQRMQWRQFGRRWSNVHGWIHVDGRPRAACLVRNVSEGGALIEIDPSAGLIPDQFTLVIQPLQIEIGCEIRHQRHGSLGIRFTGADGWQAANAIEAASHSPGGQRMKPPHPPTAS
jgi:hypothetical protein